MATPIDLTGQRYGLLTVIEFESRKGRHRFWLCDCDCGNRTSVATGHLRSGHTISCGCRQGRYVHGQARTKRVGGVTREYKLWNGARGNSKQKGMPCTIDLSDIVIPELCPLLGIPLNKEAANLAYNLPSLDRIDSTKGYTPDNIWVISYRANLIKNNASLSELKRLVEGSEQETTRRTIRAAGR